MSTLDGDRSSTFRELPTANPNPAPPVQADNGPKEVPIVKNPQDESGYEDTQPNRNHDYLKETLSPARPVSHNDAPNPGKVEEGRFYDPNQTLQASTQGSSQASPDESNQVSRDSWRQPSGESVADARVQSNETSGKGNCR